MFSITLLMFIALAIIWLSNLISAIQTIQNMLIVADHQPLENKFSKIDQNIIIVDVVCLNLQAVIVCYFQYSDIKR